MKRTKAEFRVGQWVAFVAGPLHPVEEQGRIVGLLPGFQNAWTVRFQKERVIHGDSLRPLTAHECGRGRGKK